ncbi:hypothetical protein NW754_001457 [Fusarium falciforme]|uniref:(S)-ureidoglycine aminohydrolase cupin domain-containing protein n=1 Tax=Fusarium falciforme TaxID=195108 RepID=A0A9W8QU19_9HYPO|nr:hypothetical protein NW754_001457 [Fusarium falciforme]KAJ4176275.1 hypothetical protein NW755_014506 [Fusarium falciforme]KAJ4179975.1 hypothetical protein NW759_017261 [Fusarium solani]KAJ4224591.1 hypothetical protein NW757_014346 [Fusarium falciforme]
MPYQYFKNAVKDFEPTSVLVPPHGLMDDIAPVSWANDKATKLGFYRINKGPAIEYICPTHEVKLILEGSHEIRDTETGQVTISEPGKAMLSMNGPTQN